MYTENISQSHAKLLHQEIEQSNRILHFHKHALTADKIEIRFGFVGKELIECLIDSGGSIEIVANQNPAFVQSRIKPL